LSTTQVHELAQDHIHLVLPMGLGWLITWGNLSSQILVIF
jgi:hypothetical protein